MFSWLNPWAKLRERKEAERLEADRKATAARQEQHERAARILAATMERTKKQPLRAVAPLTAQRAYHDDQAARRAWQKREDQIALDRMNADDERRRRNSESSDNFVTAAYLAGLSGSSERAEPEAQVMKGGGGSFDGGGSSGDWSRGDSGSSSSSDSGSSSSSGSDSGGSSGGGSD